MTPYSFIIPTQATNSAAGSTMLSIPASGLVSITVGHNQIVRIVANASYHARFGGAALTTATATDMLGISNTVEYFDMGRQNEVIVFFNSTASTISVWITVLSRT